MVIRSVNTAKGRLRFIRVSSLLGKTLVWGKLRPPKQRVLLSSGPEKIILEADEKGKVAALLTTRGDDIRIGLRDGFAWRSQGRVKCR